MSNGREAKGQLRPGRSTRQPFFYSRIRGRYDAATTTADNHRHWAAADGMSASAANSPDVRRTLRNRSRYEVANISYARGITLTLANDVVGTGPRLQMVTADPVANRFVEQEFFAWGEAIGLAEKLRTMRLARIAAGEAFGLLTSNGRVESPVQRDLRLIEADQVASPTLNPDRPRYIDGIQFDADGNPVSYDVLRNHPGDIKPAMDAAFAAGLEVTALHNHFFFDEPKVYFMHIGGTGKPEELAAGVKSVWDAIKEVRAERPQSAESFPGEAPDPSGKISVEPIEDILGHEGQTKDGVLKVSVAREGMMHGTSVGGSMGLTTWAAFSGSDELAAVDGDFIMTAEEVQPVLRTLRKHGIHIVALHNHMIGEKSAFYFTHF